MIEGDDGSDELEGVHCFVEVVSGAGKRVERLCRMGGYQCNDAGIYTIFKLATDNTKRHQFYRAEGYRIPKWRKEQTIEPGVFVGNQDH